MDLFSRLFKQNHSKRQFGRVTVQPFHQISLWLDDQIFDIFTISLNGFSFINKIDRKFKKDQKINAAIRLLDKVCDIEIDVRHVSHQFVGCQVIGACDVYRDFVYNYFKSEIEASKLRKIDKDKVSPDEYGEPFWYYGDNNHEIYFTAKDNKVTSLQINYHGHMFLMHEGSTSTGIVWEDLKEEPAHKSSDLIKLSDKLPKEMMEYMLRFVECTEDINSSYKDQILQIMQTRFGIDWKK
jgi:hypothetical protein